MDEPNAEEKKTTNDLTMKESLFIVVGLMLLTFVVNNMRTTTYYIAVGLVGPVMGLDDYDGLAETKPVSANSAIVTASVHR